MGEGVVLQPHGDPPPGLGEPRGREAEGPVDEADLVRALTRELHRSTDVVGPRLRPRPFDAQYWACWLVAVVAPFLLAYLFWTR